MEGLVDRLERLRQKRFAEDDRLVCMERARILAETKRKYADLSRTMRQAAILRDLCERVTPVIEPEDAIVGRMPETVPTPGEEQFIAEHPELFVPPGVPGWLDSMGIYVPEWDRLVEMGLGGLAAAAREQLLGSSDADADAENRREFMIAMVQALESVSILIRRYAESARHGADTAESPARRIELQQIAERCDRIAWNAPTSFLDALQLLQIVHMVLSCLVGGRDVTPGRLDQYLHAAYIQEVSDGRLERGDAVVLLALFLLRLSQMAGSGTDFDDDVRRTPCRYTHLYVTVGGTDPDGESVVNELSHVVLDAAQMLNYREPTVMVRYRVGEERPFVEKVADLVRRRIPVTIYHDEVVVRALVNQGVSLEDARNYAHSACHNVIVVGREAGSGPGAFHNIPRFLLLAMNGGRELCSDAATGAPTPESGEIETFDQLWDALRMQVKFHLGKAREAAEKRWRQELRNACPLLHSALMSYSFDRQAPCWRAAPISHFNHYLMGLATTVDSFTAIRRLVFEDAEMSLAKVLGILRDDWVGHEALRHRVRAHFPRYGQDRDEPRQLAAALGRMWVDEVENASRGMSRGAMWPSFYSHLVHVHNGKVTPATPDGRRNGDPLSENVGPSYGTLGCSPTSILRAMSALPFEHTPSGAASLALATKDVEGEDGRSRLLDLIDSYFGMGGLHLQINVLDAGFLEQALEMPERFSDLVVRVTGFSAYFTRLSRDSQLDLVRRSQRDGVSA